MRCISRCLLQSRDITVMYDLVQRRCCELQVMANEEVDPAVLIKLLRQEVQDLRMEIR